MFACVEGPCGIVERLHEVVAVIQLTGFQPGGLFHCFGPCS